MSEWKPIKTAPFQQVIWVKNDMMEAPVKATRGYAAPSGVCKDTTLCTGVYTKGGILGPFIRDGELVCPTHWKSLEASHE